MWVAMNDRTSSGMSVKPWARALCRRMARRVSNSGGWMSVSRPHSKRVRSRSSRVAMALGGRSEDSTSWLPRAVERVEGVEELLLEPLVVLHELHVVDEEQVDLPVAALELLAGRSSGSPRRTRS